MPNTPLRTALAEQMRDIYWAERKLVDTLPKLAEAAQDAELSKGIKKHLEETRGQVKRLERAFEALGLQARAETCEAMKGLIEEGDEVLEKHEKGMLRDALIIAACQKVEHYEIATYGTLCQWAEVLELGDVKQLLGENLQEEEATDKKLSQVARSINHSAATA
jgi:ferritin-like metal-binding protein YciE